MPPRSPRWTPVPTTAVPRNEGVPGSSPGVGFGKTRWKRRVFSCHLALWSLDAAPRSTPSACRSANAGVDREVDRREASRDDAHDERLEAAADARRSRARDAVAGRRETDPESPRTVRRRSGDDPTVPPEDQRQVTRRPAAGLLRDAHGARRPARDLPLQPAPVPRRLCPCDDRQRCDQCDREQPHVSTVARRGGPAGAGPPRGDFYGFSFAMCVDQLPSATRGPAAPGDGAHVPSLLSPVVAPKNLPPHVW